MYSKYKINLEYDEFESFLFDEVENKYPNEMRFPNTQYYINIAENMYNDYNKRIIRDLEIFINENRDINASKLQEEWFKNYDFDFFLSHSHKDEKLAMLIAGWLYKTFGLKVFIDSCVWGYCNDLLREIDNRVCKMNTGSYSYEKRNYTTANVHMMLTNALMKMIDSTECILFLNTSNSIKLSEKKSETYSSWIYNELFMTYYMRKKLPKRMKKLNENLQLIDVKIKDSKINDFLYDVHMPLDNMKELDLDCIFEWQARYKDDDNLNPLDLLYGIS